MCIFGIIYNFSQSEQLYMFAAQQDCLQNLRKGYFGRCTHQEEHELNRQGCYFSFSRVLVNVASEKEDHVVTLSL